MDGSGASAVGTMRERIRQTWETVDDGDIDRSGGSLEKLVAMISAKTGQPRTEIRQELRRIVSR
ncbi:MAG: hypothetical protein ACKVP6_10375 [Mycobacterium sp.]